MTGMLLYQTYHSKTLRKQVNYYKKQEEDTQYLTVWTLRQKLDAGEELTRSNLQEAHVQLQEADQLTNVTNIEQLIGQHAKTKLDKGTLVQPDLFYVGESTMDDVRVKELTSVKLPVQLKDGEYVDLRIGFPDGEDYIVVKHKKVIGLLRNEESQQLEGVRLELSEEELLRLSAACIDVEDYENTTLYAIQYLEDFQEEAVLDYPVNSKVYTLLQWDPNITGRMTLQGEKKKRALLESHLRQYKRASIGYSSEDRSTDGEPEGTNMKENESELKIFE